MKEIIYFFLDFVHFLAMGYLLAYLLRDMLSERYHLLRGRWTCLLMCLQFVLVRQILAQSQIVKQMMYGGRMFTVNSKQSILPVAISLICTLLSGLLLYRRNWVRLISLVTVFYALTELVRFMFYPAAVGSIDLAISRYSSRYLAQRNFDETVFHAAIGKIEVAWNFALVAVILFVLFYCVRRYRKSLISGVHMFQSREAMLLFLPGLMGLLFTAMLRCILFYYETEVYLILEGYPEMNVMIPCMSFLCIACILTSVKMLARIDEEHEKRKQVELYWSRAQEMESHVSDMENIYLKIRGMKHDMKNYMADISALLAQMASGDEKAMEEARRYVDSMETSLDDLAVMCQTSNPVTDVIVGRYLRMAKQKKIDFICDFVYPSSLCVDAFDIGIILNNGLSNAFEACEKEGEPTWVSLNARQKGRMFLISIENSFSGALKWDGEFPVSEKRGEGHGLGLNNIKNCAEKYFGKVNIQAAKKSFCLTVMLQGGEADDLMTENR